MRQSMKCKLLKKCFLLIFVMKPININVTAFIGLVIVVNSNPISPIKSPGELIGEAELNKSFTVQTVFVSAQTIKAPCRS